VMNLPAESVVYLEEGRVVAAGVFSEVRSKVPGLHRQAGLMGLAGRAAKD
jgi:hypothetical protein